MGYPVTKYIEWVYRRPQSETNLVQAEPALLRICNIFIISKIRASILCKIGAWDANYTHKADLPAPLSA